MWREEGCNNDVVVRPMSMRLAYGMSYTAIVNAPLRGMDLPTLQEGIGSCIVFKQAPMISVGGCGCICDNNIFV